MGSWWTGQRDEVRGRQRGTTEIRSQGHSPQPLATLPILPSTHHWSSGASGTSRTRVCTWAMSVARAGQCRGPSAGTGWGNSQSLLLPPHGLGEGGGGGRGEERRGVDAGLGTSCPSPSCCPWEAETPPRKVRARPALCPDLSSHFLELSELQFQLYPRCLPDSEVPGPFLCPQKEVQTAQNKCPLSSPCHRPAGLGDHCLGPSWRSGVRRGSPASGPQGHIHCALGCSRPP